MAQTAAREQRRSAASASPSDDELRLIDAWWRAANYLSVGQIYLLDNPLLREPLKPEHAKPRLLGHWGTTPGLNLVYVHLNRAIRTRDLNAMYVTGPGHGGPGIVANTYLEGTYSEFYPDVTQDESGMRKLFRQFSFPGGIPSHVAPQTPGSIHEGGELGYALVHAYGAVFDNPDLIVCATVGDGEAETGPLAASWHSNKFINPRRDGAVLPILQLNGWKIANPAVLAGIPEDELAALLEGYGHRVHLVSGEEPAAVHRAMAQALDQALDEIAEIQRGARGGRTNGRHVARPRWPMIVLRTPKGWTGPKEVDGEPVEGTWRSHQVPMGDVRGNKDHLRMLESWMRSYKPEELFDERGALRAEIAALSPDGKRRVNGQPPAHEGYLLTGRHGLFNCYEAFIHIVDSMFNQHAKWLEACNEIPWRRPIASLNYLLSSHVWRQDHNGATHQDPGFVDLVVNKKAEIIRVYLPPDANTLLSVADHCLGSRNYVNVIVAGKQPALQYLSMDDAIAHCTRGAGIWDWASNDEGAEPDVVLGCAGDVPTLETLAAAGLVPGHFPELH